MPKKKKILVVHGPNLNLLGLREKSIYGGLSLAEIVQKLGKRAETLGVEIESFQSNEEGAMVSRIGAAIDEFDGIVINPAAYTHTSIAIRDALLAARLPAVEVHLSNVDAREEFRRRSMISDIVVGKIQGFGYMSYILALDALVHYLNDQEK